MTHTPMTPAMWEEAMKYPERYCINGTSGMPITKIVDRGDVRSATRRYEVFSEEFALGNAPFYDDGSTLHPEDRLPSFVKNQTITRRPDAPPTVSQAAELGSALVTPTPECQYCKSSDFTEVEHVGHGTYLHCRRCGGYNSTMESEQATPTPEQRLTAKFPTIRIESYWIVNEWMCVFTTGAGLHDHRTTTKGASIDECINLFLEDAK